MPPTNANELKWKSMTATVNLIKSPNQFLKKLLYSNEDYLSTEDVEFSILTKDREIAPFVRKNGEGIMVPGHDSKNVTVAAPNIRIKRPFTPSELLFGRKPGTVILNIGAAAQISALQAHVARDLQGMENMIVNAEEWLCSQALQATISYSVADGDVFTITYPRAAANNITLSTFWDDGTPANIYVAEDVYAAKKVLADAGMPVPTDAICGSEAAADLRKLIDKGHIKAFDTARNIRAGELRLDTDFSEDGVLYMGFMYGLDWWEYSRTATLNGSSVDMIRPKYVEYISRSSVSERVMYYGAIPDFDALEGKNFQGKRFAKSWTVKDPSSLMALVHSRPLPVPRKVDATVSMKVSSG